MKKAIIIFLLGVVMSFFFFPFSFTFLPPSLNTKQMLAVLGIVLFGYRCIRTKSLYLPKDVLWAGIIALIFSLSCYMSITINNTNDTTYSQYIVSFFVWIFAGYAVCDILRAYYGKVDLLILTKYLAWVGVFQCVIAQVIDQVPAVQVAVDAVVNQGGAHLREINRLYGIGAALDPAGVRFAITLLLIGHRIVVAGQTQNGMKNLWGYYLAFIIITVLGDMISRTTIVGAGLGLAYILLNSLLNVKTEVKISQIKSAGIIVLILAVTVPLMVYLYNTNVSMHNHLRFAFEGFFNWVETGVWRTDSTDKLNAVMWVWPEDAKTWIVGSGLFAGWTYSTDIGYCRFILYCGLVGFSIFSAFFVYNAIALSRRYRDTQLLAILFIAMTFIIWIKVATDIFMFYALILCANSDWEEDEEEDDDEEELEALEEE